LIRGWLAGRWCGCSNAVRGIGEDGTRYPNAAEPRTWHGEDAQAAADPLGYPSVARKERAKRVFDWFSLDIIYWPVSAIMWVW